uniref:RNA polymerase II subunit A C-terminal domain phosphatase n=1 Tax=Denticeps clupeoides TaxID=299321 RepID=A0AAY4CHU0_9TELE
RPEPPSVLPPFPCAQWIAGFPTIRCPAAAGPARLLEWKVKPGSFVNVDSVLALVSPERGDGSEARDQAHKPPDKRVKSDRAGVVKELCCQPGQLVPPGSVIVTLEECSHPIVMKGLCAECGEDLTQLRSKNGKQPSSISTATVSMVHSVPELMVSSEQAEQLGREDQQRLHRNRKLVLMVDLDQTLIHTTEQHCRRLSNKGIFHFQLGRGEPMLHTRLRPHCKDFLEKIAKLYELHVFTFGSRLYAHTIAGFLDPEKKLFSHRILSRDECIDPLSKTGNLRYLFPCGDSMVCIIDDREDVWKFAPNLITVKKYTYFQGTGDINAPPGSREAQMARKGNFAAPGAFSLVKTKRLPTPGLEHESIFVILTNADRDGQGTGDEASQVIDRVNVKKEDGTHPSGSTEESGKEQGTERTKASRTGNDLDFALSSDSDSESGKAGPLESERPDSKAEEEGEAEKEKDSEQDSLKELGNGCVEKKEAETESQNSEQSGVTMGEESLDQNMDDEDDDEDEEDRDQDDHLIYLEDVLERIHSEYYSRYEVYLRKETEEMPDIRKIVPELKGRTLAGTNVVFSGLYPTNYPMERTREFYHANALGAKISKSLVQNAKDPNHTTHLIAARAGTEKVRQALSCKHLYVVNPDWLWGCLERWERVEEQLFPLKEDYSRTQRSTSPASFPDVLGSLPTTPFNPVPVQPKAMPLPPPEMRTYDPVTGKLIRRGPPASYQSSYLQPTGSSQPLPGHGEQMSFRGAENSDRDEEQPGPSRRRRQPSLSESLPLYTLCKEDLDSMDKEVDDILGEESDNESEGQGSEERMEEGEEPPQTSRQSAAQDLQPSLKAVVEETSQTPSSSTGGLLRGNKRKREDGREEDDGDEQETLGLSDSQSSKDSNEEGSSSEADEMAAALEAELNDFM